MRTPNISADVPTKHDTFTARHTNVDGRTFGLTATEFNDNGKPCDRIMVNVHHDGYFPEDGEPGSAVHTDVVNGQVVIEIGDLCVYLPRGREVDLVTALVAGIAERDRQAEAGENTCVVQITDTLATV
jgi:hypothetical protein